MKVDAVVISPCPNCGLVTDRVTYDIGSGPELSCSSCEWCWGAEGQDLLPLVPPPPPISAEQLLDMIAQDNYRHPRGHPCRDCGRFFDQHPVADDGVTICRGWR